MSGVQYPSYVNNKDVCFKHDRNKIKLQFLSDWSKVEASMNTLTPTDICAMYFPPRLEIQYDQGTEDRLVHDICQWPFVKFLSPSLFTVALDWSRFCSGQHQLSYERKVLLHRHFAWVFLMDEVSEKLPIYKLHTTAGRIYLDNLKSIMRDGQVEDMTQFKGACPDEVIESALLAQRILAEDLMPLKRKLLSPHHLQACIDTLDLYFDYQYEEGHRFCAEQASEDILKTRSFTISALTPMLLCMTPSQAGIYRPDDPCLIQISLFIALFNDIAGLFKDIDSLKTQDDGSAYLNLVYVAMNEQGLSEEASIRVYANRLNQFTRHYEYFLPTYPPLRQQLYHDMLKFCFGYYDYHLVGIQGKPNNRYGWKREKIID